MGFIPDTQKLNSLNCVFVKFSTESSVSMMPNFFLYLCDMQIWSWATISISLEMVIGIILAIITSVAFVLKEHKRIMDMFTALKSDVRSLQEKEEIVNDQLKGFANQIDNKFASLQGLMENIRNDVKGDISELRKQLWEIKK